MSRVSDRHESDLAGMLRPFAETDVTPVTVLVSSQVAHLASVQHTAWMLVNLLARLDGIVERIGFVCPDGVMTASNIVSLAPFEQDFRSAVLQGAAEIGIVPIAPGAVRGFVLEVGTDTGSTNRTEHVVDRHIHVYGEGWWGGISRVPIAGSGSSSLPFGPYTAACLAVGEVFKAARMHPDGFEPVHTVFYSTWHNRSATTPPLGGPDALSSVTLDVALAGVGAVGSTWIHAMWACPGLAGRALLCDNDPAGIDRTNLNRYPLFGMPSVGKPKASEAVRICGDGSITWSAHDGPFEDIEQVPPRVVSAVDNNRARSAIQQRYPPRILSASTLDLRAEVLRCGPPGVGACLRCYNPPEPIPTDEQVRAHLANAPNEERAVLAAAVNVSEDEVDDWIQTGRCGQASSRLLPFLRQTGASGPAPFAVSFVSAMAGILLAAETVKDHFASGVPLTDDASRAVIQFWAPTAGINRAGAYRREESCSMCDPMAPATAIWRKRYYGLPPER